MENISQNPEQLGQNMPTPVMPTPETMPAKSKKWLPIVLIIAALIGGYFGLAKFQSWWPFESVSVPLSPSPSVSADAIPNTSDWKTYRNEQFEVKYPPDLVKDSVEISQYGVDSISFYKNDGSDLNTKFQISIDTNLTGGANPLTVLKQSEKIVSGPTNLVIGGVLGKQYKIRWQYGGKEYIYNLAYIQYQNRIYEFNDLKLDEEDFKKILSTFKFIKSGTSATLSEHDCGTIGVIQSTTQQKESMSCIQQATLSCSKASVIQQNAKGIKDNKFTVLGKDNNYCLLSQETYNPKTLQTCNFPLTLMPTVFQVSKDSLAYSQNETVESLFFSQVTLSSFLSHKYTNPYTNEVTQISCK